MFVIDNFGNTTTPNKDAIELYGGRVNSIAKAIDHYGEYKLSLDSVKYLQCENGRRKEQDPYDRVCEVDFSVTKPYVIQKTPGGNITTTSQELSKFTNIDGDKTFASRLNATLASNANTNYSATPAVKSALSEFINKYSSLAVPLNSSVHLFGNGTNEATVSKVPGKDIYFVNGNLTIEGSRFNYDISKTKILPEVEGNYSIYNRPFTIVQTAGDTTIKGNLNHNMMLLTNGKITFDGSKNCNDAQVVKGIFYAGNIFSSTGVAKNDNLDNPDRCIGGNLNIKGVAIGKGLQNVAGARRSELNQWFRTRSRKTESDADRRNYIMNGAAVLIEYAPSVFTKATMPPGAEEFTQALSVYRQ